jgi:hypothetical protein
VHREAPSRVAISSACRAGSAVGSPVDALGQQRRQPHLLEHVEIVVRGGPSVPMPTFRPNSSILTGATPEPSFRLLDGLWANARARVLQRPHLALVDVHAVRGEHARVEQPLLLHPRDDRHAVLVAHCSTSSERLREVRVQRHVELAASSAHARGSRPCRCRARAARRPARSAGAPSSATMNSRAGPASPRSSPRRAPGTSARSCRTARASRRTAVASATSSSK